MKYDYDPKIYSNIFYPHVSTLSRLLTNNRCCYCVENIINRNVIPHCHHAAYTLPGGIAVRDHEFDLLGIYLFPVCSDPCHKILHTRENWYVRLGVRKSQQHNYGHVFEKLCANWNSLVIVSAYRRDYSDYSWLALDNLR